MESWQYMSVNKGHPKITITLEVDKGLAKGRERRKLWVYLSHFMAGKLLK